ncbi:MAG: hypothetical protein ACYC7D_11775 [Nitrososphaerales archaeon]
MAKNRVTSVFIALLFVLSIGMPFSSRGQFLPSAPSSLSFGYSPTTLSPLQNGIPVYSILDQMWAESVANQSVELSLISPNGMTILSTSLQPSTASLIYTFQSSDQEGVWTLSINSQQGGNSLPFLLVNPSNHNLGINLNYFSLESGQLNIGFNVSQTFDFNIEGCFASNNSLSTVFVPTPSSLGSGSLAVQWNGSASSIAIQGSISQPFSYWYELYYSYSYSNTNTSQLVSRDSQVAKSDVALITQSTSQASVAVSKDAVLREGRYVMRSYFESASGLTVSESRILILGQGAPWFWLTSCNPFSIPASTSFQKSVSLTGNSTQWPYLFYYMYDVEGVDALGVLPLNIQIARINFKGSPWNVPLNGISFALNNNSAIETSSSYQGSIYIASNKFPLEVTVRPSFGGQELQAVIIDLNAASTDYAATIPIGKIIAQETANGSPLNGTTVELLNMQNDSLMQSTVSGGNASFYVPPGSYLLKGSFGASTEVKEANVSAYGQSSVDFSFFTPQPPPEYEIYAALVLAFLGIALNVYVWIARPMLKRYTLAKRRKASSKLNAGKKLLPDVNHS